MLLIIDNYLIVYTMNNLLTCLKFPDLVYIDSNNHILAEKLIFVYSESFSLTPSAENVYNVFLTTFV